MADWERIVNTTIADHVKGFEQCVMEDRILLAELKKRGGIEYNKGGDGFTWRVKKDLRDMSTNNGAQSTSFTAKNLFKTATLDYGGYILTDKVTKREKLKNRGTAQIIDYWGTFLDDMFDDLEDQFAEELYNDGGTNTDRLSGTETMFAATQTISTGTTSSTVARSANAADPVAYPNDTYAGISTVLGAEGGSWAANWPFGSGDPVFEYFSPLIVNYTSTYFDGASATWALNCSAATSFGLIHGNRRKASQGVIDLCLFDAEMYRKLAEKQKTNERTLVNSGTDERNYGQPKKGFYMDNALITWEFGIPANIGYGFNLKQTKIRSMQDKLFNADPLDWDPASRGWRVAVDFLGQMQFKSPRYFVKFAAIA